MIRDLHMHPHVVKGAENFDAFAETALAKGITEVCITDHMPLSCSHADDRIPKGQMRRYYENALAAKEKWSGKLRVLIGLEVDYHPSFMGEIEDALSVGGLDLVLGSTHIHAVPGLVEKLGSRTAVARAALENEILAAKSGLFDIITHMDMYRWIFNKPERYPLIDDGYDPENCTDLADELFSAINEAGVRLEVNPHLCCSTGSIGDTYPCPFFIGRAYARGVRFSYGGDAHHGHEVGTLLPELRAHPVWGRAIKEFENNK